MSRSRASCAFSIGAASRGTKPTAIFKTMDTTDSFKLSSCSFRYHVIFVAVVVVVVV